jgi:hypothetical protein
MMLETILAATNVEAMYTSSGASNIVKVAFHRSSLWDGYYVQMHKPGGVGGFKFERWFRPLTMKSLLAVACEFAQKE